MKKIIAVIFCLILACGVVIGLPLISKQNTEIEANISNETSLVKQEILSYSAYEKTYNKIYANGKLVGVATDMNYINALISDEYKKFEYDFPNTEIDLTDDVYIASEKSYANFENIDAQIVDYLANNDFLGIKTTAVEFSTNDGVYDIIYVKNIDDFYAARDEFLLNFVSQDTLNKLRNNEQIAGPTEIGTVETNLKISENITYVDAIVSPNEIFTNVDDIYDFLCYGRNTEREYYTVKEGDTIQAIMYYFAFTRPEQVVNINSNVLKNTDQIITPGMQLNVTYFTSPITVNVTKQELRREMITPEAPEYIEDESLDSGKIEIIEQEIIGERNSLYQEQWVNGVIVSGEPVKDASGNEVYIDVIPAKRGKIAIGTKLINLIGTGNYTWPIDNPYITTDFGGYYGHTGTDFINKYGYYSPVYAVDSGIVDETGWKDDMGYYIMIDHQNGIRTFYMHLNSPAYLYEGDNVYRGQIIGQEGNTGQSEGIHLHLTFEVDGNRVDACRYLPCGLIR